MVPGVTLPHPTPALLTNSATQTRPRRPPHRHRVSVAEFFFVAAMLRYLRRIDIMPLKPTTLLPAIVLFLLPAVSQAAILFESGTLGPTGLTQGAVTASNISSSVFAGVRFQLSQPVVTTQIGGHFVDQANGSFFGAIIELDDQNDFPDSGDLSTPDVLGATSLTFPVPSAEVFGDLTVSLAPGWYALVFGSDLFGSTGDGAAPANNPDIETPVYVAFQPGFGWSNLTGFLSASDSLSKGKKFLSPLLWPFFYLQYG